MELLRTPRLALRSWTAGDAAAFHDIYSRWEVARWFGPHPRGACRDHDAARAEIARWRASEDPPYGLWAIVPHDVAVPVGTVVLLQLSDVDGPTGLAEIGWHLHPAHQGRGLATGAARALLGRAALPRVLALTDPDNVASQAVCDRLGMTDEGLTSRWFATEKRQYAV